MLRRLARYIALMAAMLVVVLGLPFAPATAVADSEPPSFIIFSGDEEFDALAGEIKLTLTPDLVKVVRAELNELEMWDPGRRQVVSFTRTDHSEHTAELSDRRFRFDVGLTIVGMVSAIIRLDGELSADSNQITGTATYEVDGNDWSTREFRVERTQSISPSSTDSTLRATTYTKHGPAGGLTLTLDLSGNVTSMALKGVSFGECSYLNDPSHLAVLFDDPQQLPTGNSVILSGRPQRAVTVRGESDGSTASGVLVYNDLFGCEVTLNWTTGQIPPTATPYATAISPTATRTPAHMSTHTPTATPAVSALPKSGTGGGMSAAKVPFWPLSLGAFAVTVSLCAIATWRRPLR